MWLRDDTRFTRWTCEDCDGDPDLRRSRGNCGGPFPADPIDQTVDVREDEIGTYVEVSSIVSPIGRAAGDLLEHRCRSCPVACAAGMAALFRLHLATRPFVGLGPVALGGRRLTAAAVDALALIATEGEAMHALHIEEETERHKRKKP